MLLFFILGDTDLMILIKKILTMLNFQKILTHAVIWTLNKIRQGFQILSLFLFFISINIFQIWAASQLPTANFVWEILYAFPNIGTIFFLFSFLIFTWDVDQDIHDMFIESTKELCDDKMWFNMVNRGWNVS